MIFRIFRFPPKPFSNLRRKKKHRGAQVQGVTANASHQEGERLLVLRSPQGEDFGGCLRGGNEEWLGKCTKAPMKTKRIKYTWNLEWASDLEILLFSIQKLVQGVSSR